MASARAVGRTVLLGWLGAEWVGLLIALLVAVTAFAFLIVDVLLRSPPNGVWFVPLVISAPAAAAVLAWWAADIPRELFSQARRTEPQRLPGVTTATRPARSRPEPSVAWRSTRMLSRLSAMLSVNPPGGDARPGLIIDLASRPSDAAAVFPIGPTGPGVNSPLETRGTAAANPEPLISNRKIDSSSGK